MSSDREEFVALVDAHGGALLATLRRLCGNNHDAEDCFQETAARVWRRFDDRPSLRSPRAWLITISYRVFLDHRRRVRCGAAEPPVDVIDHRTGSPEGAAEHAETCGQLNHRIEQLPGPLREVVVLHYMGGLTIRQTAAALGVTVAIAKNRLHAALKQLRSDLE